MEFSFEIHTNTTAIRVYVLCIPYHGNENCTSATRKPPKTQ